jgi:hypothetical protein
MRKFIKRSELDVRGPTLLQDEAACKVIRDRYFLDVRKSAWRLMLDIQSGAIESPSQFADALDEHVKNHPRLMRRSESLKGLLSSMHPESFFDEMQVPLDPDLGPPYETLMYYSYSRDVMGFIQDKVNLHQWPDPLEEITYE